MTAPRLLIAGTQSGAGKTTLTLGLAAALRARGLSVQPFKVGPDYIDPGYHTLAAGRPCFTLDSWMLGADGLRRTFAQAAAGAEISLIEGMMGLFDGTDADGDAGSSAEVARLLATPVVLVFDAAALAGSAAALVFGFARFRPDVRLAGVIARGVAGPGHAALVRRAVEQGTGVPLLGFLPTDEQLRIPERHLGLLPAAENPRVREVTRRLAAVLAANCDLERILALARGAEPLPPAVAEPPTPAPDGPAVRIAYAWDAAFHFYYPENLARLRAAGAETVPFSPLADQTLPADIAALYLGGGFPESFAANLSANTPLHRAVRAAAAAGMPVYAECGGLMWLARHIEDLDGRRFPQVGLLPSGVRMTGRLAGFGYRAVEARSETAVLPVGGTARGHEFHHSALDPAFPATSAAHRAWGADGEERAADGLAQGSLTATYIHLHFGSNPALAPRFVQRARRFAAQGAG